MRALGKALALVTAVPLLRRIPAELLPEPLVHEPRTGAATLFVRWFGPMRIRTLFFTAVACERTGNPDEWRVGTLLIAARVVAHDSTSTLESGWLAGHSGVEATQPSGG